MSEFDVISYQDIHWIATSVLNTRQISLQKTRFYNSLANPGGELLSLENRAYMNGDELYVFISSCLLTWRSRNSNKATFGHLRDILIQEGFLSEADDLMMKMNEWKISKTNSTVSSDSNDENSEVTQIEVSGDEKEKREFISFVGEVATIFVESVEEMTKLSSDSDLFKEWFKSSKKIYNAVNKAIDVDNARND